LRAAPCAEPWKGLAKFADCRESGTVNGPRSVNEANIQPE